MFLLLIRNLLLASTVAVGAPTARWRDTGSGAVILEEAWSIPELFNATGLPIGVFGPLIDVHNRLNLMDQNDVDFMVLSCASPCVQGISDPTLAPQMAMTVNDRLADVIKNSTARFGGFATVSMHNPTEAAEELKRTVKKYGFLGALVNDYQQSGPDNATLLFYDQPQYDVFWKTVTDLDVPVYFHPRGNIAQLTQFEYAHAPALVGAVQEWAVTLSNHLLGLAVNGVFDRFPTLKIIAGHLGERVSSDLLRIDQRLIGQSPQGLVMKHNISYYWKTNVYETTSGNFATPLLNFHRGEIGLDRIMYSVDYPFVSIEEGAAWIVELSKTMEKKDLLSLKRGVAIKVLKLDG